MHNKVLPCLFIYTYAENGTEHAYVQDKKRKAELSVFCFFISVSILFTDKSRNICGNSFEKNYACASVFPKGVFFTPFLRCSG